MADAKVLPLPPGSLLVLHDVVLGDENAEVTLTDELVAAIGHMQFAILSLTTGADAEVWGPDTDQVARIRELLDEHAAKG